MAAPRASRARHAFFVVLAALVAVAVASDAAVAQEQLDAAAARALLQAPAPAAPAVKYCIHAFHEKKHHHHLGDNSEAPVSTTTTSTSTDVPGPDDPDCVQPPPWHRDYEGSGEGGNGPTTEDTWANGGPASAPAPSGYHSSSEGSGDGSGTETSEYHWPNGGPKPAPAPGPAHTSDYGVGSGEGGWAPGAAPGAPPEPPRYAVVSTDNGAKLLVPTDELVHQTPVVTPTDITHIDDALTPDVNVPLVFTSTEHSIGSEPGLPPYPMVSVKEPILSDNQQAQLRVLVKADPNAIGWCPMCPGQVMPPLPPVAFTCPTCPEGETCGPCKAGETINPAATMYIALGAPASCPACPNGEPTKQDVQEQHNDDKNQLPADLGSADTLAKQNGENVTVHVKHHHKPHRHGGYITEENVTYTSDGNNDGGISTTTSSTSESTTTTTTTSSTTSTEDYDYIEYDYVTTTTTTDASGGRGGHGHRIKVPLPAVQGKKKTHHHNTVGAPPHTTTSPLSGGGGEEKKIRVPGVPPGQAVIGTTPVTVSDINGDLSDFHDHIQAGGLPTETHTDTDMGVPTDQISSIGDVVAKNPSIVGWCPVCAGQSAPPLLPIQYPCPACPAGQICGSCVPGDNKDSSDATMFLNIGECPACPAHDTKSDWHSKHNGTVQSHTTHLHNAKKIATGNHKKVVVHTKHHHRPGTDNVTTTTTTSTELPWAPPNPIRDHRSTSSSTENFDTSTASVSAPPPPHPAVQVLGAPPGGITVVKVTSTKGLTPAPGGALKLGPGSGGVGDTPATTVKVITEPNGTVIYELPADGIPGTKGYKPKPHPPPRAHAPPHAHPPPRAYHYIKGAPGHPPRRVPVIPTPSPPGQASTPIMGPSTPITGPHAAAQYANTPYWSTTTTTTDTATTGNYHPAPPSSGHWCSICLDQEPPMLSVSANISCPDCPVGQVCPSCPVGSYVGAGRKSRSLLLSRPTWLGGKPAAASDEAGGDISNYVVGVTSTLPRNLGGPTMYLSATSCTPCVSKSRR